MVSRRCVDSLKRPVQKLISLQYIAGQLGSLALGFSSSHSADLRSCRVRELEEKRINKEMAHIRQKFKGAFALTRLACD